MMAEVERILTLWQVCRDHGCAAFLVCRGSGGAAGRGFAEGRAGGVSHCLTGFFLAHPRAFG